VRSRRALLAGKTRQPITNVRSRGKSCDSTWSGLSNRYPHAIPFGQYGECCLIRYVVSDEYRPPASPGWTCHELFDSSALAEACVLDLEDAFPGHNGELIAAMGSDGCFHHLLYALGGVGSLAEMDGDGDRFVLDEDAWNFSQRGQQPSNSVWDGWRSSRDFVLSRLEPDFGSVNTGSREA